MKILCMEPRGTLDHLAFSPQMERYSLFSPFHDTKAVFSWFRVCAGKQDRPHQGKGGAVCSFPVSLGCTILSPCACVAADSTPSCSGLDFSVTKCFHTLLKEKHPNPVKGQGTPSFQCTVTPPILGIYFQILLHGQCKKKDTCLWKVTHST